MATYVDDEDDDDDVDDDVDLFLDIPSHRQRLTIRMNSHAANASRYEQKSTLNVRIPVTITPGGQWHKTAQLRRPWHDKLCDSSSTSLAPAVIQDINASLSKRKFSRLTDSCKISC